MDALTPKRAADTSTIEATVNATPDATVDAAYFDAMYDTTDDPWHMETRWYEARKRNLLCNVLPRRKYRRAFEPGCGAGLLTEALAPRCDAIVATDLHQRAVQAAKRRLAAHEHVEVCQLAIPQQWPEGRFDLIVVSELGYYFEPTAWRDIARRLYDLLTSEGTLVTCHWRHDFDARVTPTAFVHDALRSAGIFHSQCIHDEPDFLLEVLTRNATSIAQYEQLR